MKEEELTEDQIIKEELKKTPKQDIMCYIGMGICLLMIFMPAIFKKIFYDPSMDLLEVEVVYTDLYCKGNIGRGDYQFYTEVTSKYEDSVINNTVITYTYKLGANVDEKTLVVPEINQLLEIDVSGLKKEKKANGYQFTIDFEENRELMSHEVLKEFAYAPPTQMNKFRELKVSCQNTSETVLETKYRYEIEQRSY